MKKILIVFIILIIVGGGFFVWFLLKGSVPINSGKDNTVTQGVLPITSPATKESSLTVPAGDTIAIGTTQGIITVKNFYKNVVGWQEEYAIFKQSAAYDLLYDTEDSSFVVSIKSGVLSQVRPLAEQAFLDTLGISQNDACKLVVIVGVDPLVDPSLANRALSLSFCASSTFGE